MAVNFETSPAGNRKFQIEQAVTEVMVKPRFISIEAFFKVS
jgi:hypothetical protein